MKRTVPGHPSVSSPILELSGISPDTKALVGNPSGFLYGAQDPSRPDHLKLGQTTKSPLVRIAKQAGYAQPAFAPLFWFNTPDSLQSERIWFSLLAEFKHPAYRELFCVPREVAIDACKKAIAATRVIQRPAIAPSNTPTVTGNREAVEYLLRCPMQFQGHQVQLADVVGLAQRDAHALKRLYKLGLVAKGWDAEQPEYRFDFDTGGVLLKWLLASPYTWADLGDVVGCELRVVFNIRAAEKNKKNTV